MPSNQATHPALTSQTSHAVFAPLIGVAYTSWLLGAKKESKGLEALECSSVMCCGRGPQGSIQLERRLAQGRSLQRARYNLARSTIR